MDEDWIEWKGGEWNVSPAGNADIEVRFRGGGVDADRGDVFYWEHANCGSDIIAYRIIKEPSA